jgi:hypothetical protein
LRKSTPPKALLTLGAIFLALVNTPVTAGVTPVDSHLTQQLKGDSLVATNSMPTAQRSLCRRVISPSLSIFASPSTNSASRGTLSTGQQVTLARGHLGRRGADGQFYLQITSPSAGYILARQQVSPGGRPRSTVGYCK